MKFGAILKNLREEKRLTQDELGKVFNVHKATISKWEKGGRTPDIETLNMIAEYFGVKLDYLFGNEEETELLQAIKRVNSDTSQQGKNKAAMLINMLIETGMIDKNGEADAEVWALIRSAIRKQAQEVYDNKEDANK